MFRSFSLKSSLTLAQRRWLATPASLQFSRPSNIQQTAKDLQISWGNSLTPFYYLWLRDNCRCPKCYHPITKQRLVDTFKISPSVAPKAVDTTDEGITITWNDQERHETFYPWHFLQKQAYHKYEPRIEDRERITWDRTIENDIPTADYEQVNLQGDEGEKAVLDWVTKIRLYGFAFIKNIPGTPEATEQLLRRLCFIRETHYGGFWDFTANMEHGDLAYSDVWLNAHTDGTYWTDPPGLQLFHLLSPAQSHKGGLNLLVDGFHCANVFRKQRPDLYHILSTVPIPTQAKGTSADGMTVDIRPLKQWSAFEHDIDGKTLIRVRWNGDDRRTLPLFQNSEEMEKWYEATIEWEKILRNPNNELWTEMKMGTAIIFDNHRVLHGRSSFTGSRRLCGAYLNHDDFISRLRTLEKKYSVPLSDPATPVLKHSEIWDD